ncbi:hypothetical protein [Wocania ichthyoenteri]|uniref:hypothetical protein n=1 Tax=Wocania ichthyoenteri TaxID=1230531 RepID=UPI00053DCC7C|nr:hypothetical protein [Wocania ichthyoenteri]
MIIKIILGIVILIVLMNLFLKGKRKKFIKTIKTGILGTNLTEIKNQLKKYENISDIINIENKKYLIVKTLQMRTFKVFEFENDICTGFYIKSTDMAYSLPTDFKYDLEFDIIEDDNFFTQGIDTSEPFKTTIPKYLTNGLLIRTNNRFGKFFKSIPRNETKYRPLSIFILNKSELGLNQFIKTIENDLAKELMDFNTDKMETRFY